MKILSQPHRPSALFAVNDELAIGVLAAAHQQGLVIGEDLSWSATMIFLVSRLPVALTSVRTPLEHIASNAVDMLLNPEINNNMRITTPSLIPRKSTASPRK